MCITFVCKNRKIKLADDGGYTIVIIRSLILGLGWGLLPIAGFSKNRQMIKVGSLICLDNWPNWVQMFGELKWNVKRKYLISNFSLFGHVDTEYHCCYENHQLEQRN